MQKLFSSQSTTQYTRLYSLRRIYARNEWRKSHIHTHTYTRQQFYDHWGRCRPSRSHLNGHRCNNGSIRDGKWITRFVRRSKSSRGLSAVSFMTLRSASTRHLTHVNRTGARSRLIWIFYCYCFSIAPCLPIGRSGMLRPNERERPRRHNAGSPD